MRLAFLLVTSGSIAALAAACGPAAVNQPHPIEGLLPEPQETSAAPVVSAAPELPPEVKRSGNQKNTTLVPSRFGRELSALGLDPAKLPKLASMTREQKKGIMPLFAKSLGYEKEGDPGCGGCHVAGHFESETRNRALAREMYDRWSTGFDVYQAAAASGERHDAAPTTLFCDSCHDKKPKALDRSDPAALKEFMKAEYAQKLIAKNETAASCASCHGSDLELSIFDKVWKIPAAPGAAPAAPR